MKDEHQTPWVDRALSYKWLRSSVRILLVVVALLVSTALFVQFVGSSRNDYFFFFRPATLSWLQGQSRLYDSASAGFYAPPWAVFLLVPTVLVPPAAGQAMLSILTMVGVIMALHVFGSQMPVWVRVTSAVQFWVFMELIAGNLDGIVLLGFCLSWLGLTMHRPSWLAIGLWLGTLKLISAVPLGLFAVLMAWNWTWREKLAAVSLLLGSFVFSFPLFGWDWPLRYWQSYHAAPPLSYPLVTIWKLAAQAQLPTILVIIWCLLILLPTGWFVWKRGCNALTFSLTISAWMLITPYALGIHYVLLIPAFLLVGGYSFALGVIAFLLSFLPVLRVWYSFEIVTVELLYPLTLWLALVFIAYTPQCQGIGSGSSTKPGSCSSNTVFRIA